MNLKPIDLCRLKEFVAERLPCDWVVRDLILKESDNLSPVEFCIKSELWLALLRREGNSGRK